MTYIRLDDSWIDHPKVAGLSDSAKVLYIAGLSYASRHTTDGALAGKVWRTIGGTARTVQELVNGGLWEAADDGFAIHDYLKHQRSKAEIEADREKARERWKKGRKEPESPPNFGRSSGEVRGSLPASEGRGRAEVGTPSGVGAPDGAALPPLANDVLGTLLLRIGDSKVRRDPSIEAELRAILAAHPVEVVEAAIRASDEAGDGPWPGAIRKHIRASKVVAEPPPREPGAGIKSFDEMRAAARERAGMTP